MVNSSHAPQSQFAFGLYKCLIFIQLNLTALGKYMCNNLWLFKWFWCLSFHSPKVNEGQWSLQWRHNGRNSLLKSPASPLFTQPFIQVQIKETSKLCITGLCAGNSPVTGEFPAQTASNAENVSIWWRQHVASSETWYFIQQKPQRTPI